jgi:hypothetical protein
MTRTDVINRVTKIVSGQTDNSRSKPAGAGITLFRSKLFMLFFSVHVIGCTSIATPPKLVSFKEFDDKARVEVEFSTRVDHIDHYVYDKQQSINLDNRKERSEMIIKRLGFVGKNTAGGKLFQIQLVEEQFDQPNILILYRCYLWKFNCQEVGYLEILRQSSKLLYEKWQFKKAGGYSVLGRTNIQTVKQEIQIIETSYIQPLDTEETLPDFTAYQKSYKHLGQDVSLGIGIASYMWAQNPELGASNSREPFTLSPLTRLRMLSAGEWSTSCGDFMFIYTNIAAFTAGIAGIRTAQLYQYSPQFPGLIAHSHAAAEMYSAEDNKWIYFDPWFGLIFRDKEDKKLLSLTEIYHKLRANQEESIETHHLFEGRPN